MEVICGQQSETAMSPDNVRRVDALASKLAETLMTAAICVQEIRTVLRSELDDDEHHRSDVCSSGSTCVLAIDQHRPLLDESTLSVLWRGKVLHLGQTLSFRLLARLARRPNQYVTHVDLLRDVWDDDELLTATSTIRSLVRELRRKLHHGDMTDLARAIRGHN